MKCLDLCDIIIEFSTQQYTKRVVQLRKIQRIRFNSFIFHLFQGETVPHFARETDASNRVENTLLRSKTVKYQSFIFENISKYSFFLRCIHGKLTKRQKLYAL